MTWKKKRAHRRVRMFHGRHGSVKNISVEETAAVRKKINQKMKEWEFQLLLGKGWNPRPHSLLGNPQLSWEPHDPVFRRNVLSAGGRALSFKRGWGETHCPAYRHLNWSVFTLTFSTAATDTSQTWDCVKCEIAHVNISTVRRAYAGTPHLFIYFSFYGRLDGRLRA